MSDSKNTLRAIIHASDLKELNLWKDSSNLEYLSISSNKSFIKLASFPYPKIIFKKTIHEILCSYVFVNNNKFTISLSKEGCQICTPPMAELQIFYFKTANTIYLADSFFELVELIPQNELPKINLTGVLEYCIRTPSIKTRTILNNISLLSENMILTWNKRDIDLKLFKPVEEQLNSFPVPKTKLEAINKITNLILTQIEKIPQNIKKVSTLSGGTDSAIISHLAFKTGSENFATMILSDKDSITQKKQLNQLKKYIKGNFFISKIDKQPLLLSDKNWQLDPYINGYLSINTPLIEQSRVTNCKIQFNGLGGDDFFHTRNNTKINSKKPNKTDDLSQYFTELSKTYFSEKHTSDDSKNITSLLPPNISSSLLQDNIPWRKAGIWPISPFVSASAISYSLHLPKEMMYNKSVLHTYLEDNFKMTPPKKKDSFTEYFSENLKKLVKELGTDFYENSLLFSSKLFNNSEILDLVKRVGNNTNKSKSSTNSEEIFLFFFTRLEKYFQYLYT